jgi:hypothetical protein
MRGRCRKLYKFSEYFVDETLTKLFSKKEILNCIADVIEQDRTGFLQFL